MKVVKIIISAVALFSALFLFGCKSTNLESGDLPPVHPLSLLDRDFSIYMSVPVQNHQKLTSRILQNQIEGLSEKNANLIAQHIDQLYAGVGTKKDRSLLQVSADCNVPKVAVNSALTKKNGWNKSAYSSPSSEDALSKNYPCDFTVFRNEHSGFETSLPSSELVVLARDVHPMLDKYSIRESLESTPYNDWCSQDSEDILFFITRPGQYLRSLIGQAISIGTDYIYGRLVRDGDNYTMSFYIHMTDKRGVFALKSLLSLSFSMMGGKVAAVDDYTMELSGIEVSEKQINDIFSRDPITGKHYKVVNDVVVEEKIKK